MKKLFVRSWNRLSESEPETLCEGIHCDYWDSEKEECAEGHFPDSCPMTPMDADTRGDMEYHRRKEEDLL